MAIAPATSGAAACLANHNRTESKGEVKKGRVPNACYAISVEVVGTEAAVAAGIGVVNDVVIQVAVIVIVAGRRVEVWHVYDLWFFEHVP